MLPAVGMVRMFTAHRNGSINIRLPSCIAAQRRPSLSASSLPVTPSPHGTVSVDCRSRGGWMKGLALLLKVRCAEVREREILKKS